MIKNIQTSEGSGLRKELAQGPGFSLQHCKKTRTNCNSWDGGDGSMIKSTWGS